jgi:hypothetical protein
MSWSIHSVGKRQDLAPAIRQDPHLPPAVAHGIGALLDALPERHYSIESAGHVDGLYGTIAVTIKPVEQV